MSSTLLTAALFAFVTSLVDGIAAYFATAEGTPGWALGGGICHALSAILKFIAHKHEFCKGEEAEDNYFSMGLDGRTTDARTLKRVATVMSFVGLVLKGFYWYSRFA